jgi:hypothetical protein
MNSTADLDKLNPQQLRELAASLMDQVRSKQTLIDKLTHEMATLKRLKFAATSEAYTGSGSNCCSRRLIPTWRHCQQKLASSHRLRRPGQTNSNPNVHHYPPICHGAR